jgi:hypothetical protein
MKKILAMTIFAATLMVGCNNDLESEGVSRTTYFPTFELEGESFYLIDEDQPFEEPGITVTEQGAPISFNTQYIGRYTGYTGTTIGTEADEYRVTYDAVNKDGFAASETRTVAKVNTGDFVSSISGAYLASSVRVSGEAYEDVLVLVTEVEPDVFEVSDALGGFYSDGRALGDDYLVHGLQITVNDIPSNDFSFTTDVERGDGTPLTVDDVEIDDETRTITLHTVTDAFASGDWEITLTQIQPE